MDFAIPVSDQLFVHFLNRRERTIAHADNVAVSKMQIAREENHISSLHFSPFYTLRSPSHALSSRIATIITAAPTIPGSASRSLNTKYAIATVATG